jgi:hypothetical protein
MSEKKMVKIMQPSGSNKCSGDSLSIFEVVSICVEIEFNEKGQINLMNHKKIGQTICWAARMPSRAELMMPPA